MSTLAKINGLAAASIAKVNALAKASIAKVDGIDMPAPAPSGATWNPADKGVDIVLSNGNLTASNATSSYSHVVASVAKTSGKWYAEFTVDVLGASGDCFIGWTEAPLLTGNREMRFVDPSIRRVGWRSNGTYYGGNVTSAGVGYTVGDVVMVAVDFATGDVWFGKNGSWNGGGDPAAGTGANVNYADAFAQSSSFGWGPDNDSPETKITGKFAAPFAYTPPTGFAGL